MSGIRVALVNDYDVVVQGLASMLRSYTVRVRVVELDSNKDVGAPVDVVLFDTFANVQGASIGVQTLVKNPVVAKVAVYSWSEDKAVIARALRDGADGYISKGLPAGQLVDALEAVHRGGQRVHGANVASGRAAGDWPGREEGLTQREAEMLALITQGLSNAEISECTHLSINSVKSYIRSCYRRIGVKSRTTAVLWGVDHGFLPDRRRMRGGEIEQ